MHSPAHTHKHARTDRHYYHNNHNIVAIQSMDRYLLYTEYKPSTKNNYFIYDFSPYFPFFKEKIALFVTVCVCINICV